MEKKRPKSKCSILPAFAGDVARRFPGLWKAYESLGKAAGAAGPLTAREQRLVKLALAIGAGSDGSTHSHARRAFAEGLNAKALGQVALLAVPSLGRSSATRGLAWIEDETEKGRKSKKIR
jgi:alkylhydroperoxidase/carboxymuconolactone decarboxylase family protein YurZ